MFVGLFGIASSIGVVILLGLIGWLCNNAPAAVTVALRPLDSSRAFCGEDIRAWPAVRWQRVASTHAT